MRGVASSGLPIPQGTDSLKHSSESSAWTVHELLRSVALRGQHPAVIVSGVEGVAVWTCEAIAQASMALARRLRRDGIAHSKRVALWAPNSPQWIIVALAVMAAGGVLVPIDDLAQVAELEAALDCSGARQIFISARHFTDFKDVLTD
jgi:acyl-CoA synthetase (AMP-forming)/AMP-acid ligase II